MNEIIIKRLKEPSTYAGLGVIVLVFAKMNGQDVETIINTIVAAMGAMAVLMGEGKSNGNQESNSKEQE